MNKPELIKKIKRIEALSNEEKANLIELLNHNKRYGLVWEEKSENAEDQLRDNLPVLKEVMEKKIIVSEDSPNHILIEADNFHALTALTFTHEGKIDVIYIDPPYNTGKRNEFRYNDSWVDLNSPYRHSLWLSFLSKRLRLAKKLLSKNSAIYISIDNNEFAQLKLLCDEIFGQENFIGSLIWRKKDGGGQTDEYFVTEHEYIFCYKKGDFCWIDETEEHNVNSYKREDDKGRYKLVKLEKWGSGARKEDRLTMHFPLTAPDKTEFTPIAPDGNPGRFRVGRKTMDDIIAENRLHWEFKNRWIPYEKVYYVPEKEKVLKARSILYKIANTGDGTNELTEIFGIKGKFENPKPTALINFILSHSTTSSSIVLDFFAGSGSTLHATMQLNEDGGTRQCILVTNNENNICEEITYERNRRVIQGYTNTKGETIDGLTENNLRYFKTEFVGRERSLKNKRRLTELSVDLLRIKENCYKEIKGAKNIRIFNKADIFLVVVADDVAIPKAIELIQQIPHGSIIKVYVFSEEQDPYTEDFYEVVDRVELCALPDAIYKAYQHVLPKRKTLLKTEESTISSSLN